MAEYVELHCHSCFSFREGASTPLELVLRASELGYSALALTDHDSLAGAMEFARDAKDQQVKAIIGAELTLQGGTHLTLLAETPRGYANFDHYRSRRRKHALQHCPVDGRRHGFSVNRSHAGGSQSHGRSQHFPEHEGYGGC